MIGDEHVVLTWDWRGQPDLRMLDRAVRGLTSNTVAVTEVETGSDAYAVVVGPPLSKEKALAVWEARWDDEEGVASETETVAAWRPEQLYYDGCRDALRWYAYMKDGVSYVGSCGRTLKEALADVDEAERKGEPYGMGSVQ